MNLISLNLSQKEIAMSERINGETALNTISLRLLLADCPAEVAVSAVDAVLESADIFTATVDRTQEEWRLAFAEQIRSRSVFCTEKTAETAHAYTEQADRLPIDPMRELYRAEVHPICGGGSLVYVRFHHLIIDGFGMSLFVQRVLDVLAGKELPYSHFASDCGETEPNGDLSFWNAYFENAEFSPSVFTEKASDTAGNSLFVSVPAEVCAAVRSFAKRVGVTEPYVFASAYALYLAEATGKRDAVFLMPRLNRTAAQRGILGCYTLLVPVRVHVEPSDTFETLCRKVAESAQAASAHKDVGYDRILSALREQDLLTDALSEYVFNFYRHSFETSLRCEVSYSVAGAMRNHLTWNLFRTAEGGCTFRIDYREGVYTRRRVSAFADAMLSILSRGMQNCRLSELPIVSDGEYATLMTVRGKSFDIDRELTIPSLFRRAAARYADRPAVYAGEHALTYAELDALSDRIATALVSRGVTSEDCVAYMLTRDWRLIPTVLGISKAGAAFIPVDPAYPRDRVDYIIENSRAVYLISSENVPCAENYTYLEVNELLCAECNSESLPTVRQEQLAYIIYTSGTTGRPKGVMLSHRGIANITHPDNNPFNRDVTANCRGIVAIGSVCFDISLFELFVPLMNGLFVEFGNEQAMVDAVCLSEHITRHGADILHCTPSRIAAYLSEPTFADALRGVKAILAAGEVLPGSLAEELRDTYGIRIYNGYGPTETTIGATITEAGDTLTIGAPIANMGVILLNGNRKAVPFGAIGEICVWGDGVGIGYRDRAEETASKYLDWNGLRLYRTGDLGHLSEDGRLIYHGRNDRQIKLRGLRIELSEIEKVLGEYAGIAACNCLVRKIDRTEHLVGFYTVAVGATVEEKALRAHMKSRLTSYMVPDILKELSAMPQTPGGKTDLNALAAEPIEYVRVYRAPVSVREQAVCDVFAKVLETERVGLDDNFFELGGSSLKAATAVLQIESVLHAEAGKLDFGDLYKYPTPALLLEKLYGETERDTGYDLGSLDYSGIDKFLASHTAAHAEKKHLGNVLLTGVTGYLGIHLLIDLLRHPDICGKIVCLARPKRKLEAARRVKTNLFYFAEEDFSEEYGEKWIVAEGDLTNPEIFTDGCPVPIDTVMNSAANVAHFAYGDVLEKTNTDGVKNLIRFALREQAMLCQISTISVAGVTDGSAGKDCFTEKDFYIGQQIHNSYIYSKYMAEYEMLRAAVDSGLRVKLMRVGNLQGRIQDGEFQMNMQSNAFTRQLSSYVQLGVVPQSVYAGTVNFSPVDETARNIILLTATDDSVAVFHVYPPEEVAFSDLFDCLQKLEHPIRVVTDEAFAEVLAAEKQTEEGRERVEGLIGKVFEGDCTEIPVTQELTDRCIRSLRGSWSRVDEAYLTKYLSALFGTELF